MKTKFILSFLAYWILLSILLMNSTEPKEIVRSFILGFALVGMIFNVHRTKTKVQELRSKPRPKYRNRKRRKQRRYQRSERHMETNPPGS